MHVQEYNHDCPDPNARRVYLGYLDSVYFFQPSYMRTKLYHELIIGYLEYCGIMGYRYCHIWACPPKFAVSAYGNREFTFALAASVTTTFSTAIPKSRRFQRPSGYRIGTR